MNRLALIAASLALVACTGRSPWASGSAKSPAETAAQPPSPAVVQPAPETPAVAAEPAAPGAPEAAKPAARYSWQKKTDEEAAPVVQVKTGAPDDASKCRILAFQPEHGLIVFAAKEKPSDGTTLQLTKGDRAVLIRVIRSDANSTIADIVSGQDLSKMPSLEQYEEVLCGAPADLPVE